VHFRLALQYVDKLFEQATALGYHPAGAWVIAHDEPRTYRVVVMDLVLEDQVRPFDGVGDGCAILQIGQLFIGAIDIECTAKVIHRVFF